MILGITWSGLLLAAAGQLLVVAAFAAPYPSSSRHVVKTVGLVLAGDAAVFCLLAMIAAVFQHLDFPGHRREAILLHILSAAAIAWVIWGLAVHTATGRPAVWAAGALLAVTFAGLTAPGIRRSESHKPAQVSLVTVEVPGLPKELEGLRIVLLSDTHVGPYTDAAAARARLRPLHQLKADLVAFTGDLASGETSGIGAAASLLDELTPREPRFAVLGNHDHYLDPELATAQLAEHGFKVLTNCGEGVRVKGKEIWMVGVDDPYTDASEPLTAFSGVPAHAFVILLAHTPDIMASPVAARANLILAGHTHGGQIVLPMVGPVTANSRYGVRYASGLFDVGQSKLYVTRGLGEVNIPLRVLCPPEIALLVLNGSRS